MHSAYVSTLFIGLFFSCTLAFVSVGIVFESCQKHKLLMCVILKRRSHKIQIILTISLTNLSYLPPN